MNRGLLSPRARGHAVMDFGERRAFVGTQRIGRGRARRRLYAIGRFLRRLAIVTVVASIPAALGAAGWWLLTSPHFAVRDVEVRGAHVVSKERVVEAAGIAPGISLFRLDPRAVVERVQALPEVQRADVIRELPNRVTVMIEERKPFTLVHAGRLHWIDEGGHVIGRESQAVASPAPVISGLDESELLSMSSTPNGKARDAIRLIRTLLRSGGALATEISEIDMSRPDGPVLYTVTGVEVRLGAEDWDERLARLEGVLAQNGIRDGAIRSVDLRFRDQVVLQGGR